VMACGGGEESTAPPPRAGIQIVAGANVTDSVDAILPQRLVIEVRDSAGRLVPAGTAVVFTGVPNGGGVGSVGALVFNRLISSFFPAATDSTDQAGRVQTMVRLGPFAAPAIIVISVRSLNLTDIAHYTVVPGAASQVIVAPKDTVFFIGRTYTMRGTVADRHANPRTEPVTWSTADSGITISTSGAVTASVPGRYTIAASSQNIRDTASLSAVPQGTLAVWNLDGSYVSAVDLDGSNLRKLAPVSDGGANVSPHPSWIPGTDKIIYNTFDFDAGVYTLRIVDAAGVSIPFTPQLPPNVTHRIEPIPSPDGRWMFFSAADSVCSIHHYCIYRSALDGSAAQLLGSVVNRGLGWRPAPSPDGTKVAFVTASSGGARILIYDIATQTIGSLGAFGQNPRWSRVSSQIVFVRNGGGPLMLMNADGTGQRVLTALNTLFREEPMTWSPDGRWIVARDTILNLVNVSTGMLIPLTYSRGLQAPSWK
ncbi:MAG: hypothetical protein AB1762_18325, partial [Gemmatimonadota bacterium]